jgi:hypothetical protein
MRPNVTLSVYGDVKYLCPDMRSHTSLSSYDTPTYLRTAVRFHISLPSYETPHISAQLRNLFPSSYEIPHISVQLWNPNLFPSSYEIPHSLSSYETPTYLRPAMRSHISLPSYEIPHISVQLWDPIYLCPAMKPQPISVQLWDPTYLSLAMRSPYLCPAMKIPTSYKIPRFGAGIRISHISVQCGRRISIRLFALGLKIKKDVYLCLAKPQIPWRYVDPADLCWGMRIPRVSAEAWYMVPQIGNQIRHGYYGGGV